VSCLCDAMRTLAGRRWCFTSFLDRAPALTGPVRYAVWQPELAPDTGRKHWQGFVIFDKPVSYTQVKQYLDDNAAHVELARGTTEQCRVYCTKEESRVPDTHPTEVGEPPLTPGQAGRQGGRDDLDEFIQSVKDGTKWPDLLIMHAGVTTKYLKWCQQVYLLWKPKFKGPVPTKWYPWQEHFMTWLDDDDYRIRWYVDEKGGKGKSTLAMYLYDQGLADLYRGGKTENLAFLCSERKCQIIDLCREKAEYFSYEILEQFNDGFIQSTKFECKRLRIPKSKVAVFANWWPTEGKISEHKFHVIEIKDL